MKVKSAVVIGSGVAGLATACRLAASGMDVQVFEQNSYPGGKLSSFEKEGFVFDAGPSLFTQPQNLEELFKECGRRLSDYLTYERVPVSNHYFFESGKKVRAYANAEDFAAEMETVLGESRQAVRDYLNHSEKLYKNIGTLFLNKSLHKFGTWASADVVRAIGSLQLKYLNSTLDQFNRSRFKTPEAVQIFNRFATYNGSSPFKTPAMLSLIPHLEINEGTFYPKGGMISITNALFKLASDLGVKFKFNCPVEKIHEKDGIITGVTANNLRYDTGLVVSNMDVYYTYKFLLGENHRAQKVLQQERSSSAVIYYWGMNAEFPELDLHNIFFSRDYLKEFEGIFRTGRLSDDPTVYVNITSKMEQGHSPQGKENWFVMINAPAHTGQSWQEVKLALRQAVVLKLSRMLGKDIGSLIETEETLDPYLIQQRTSSHMGSLYGTSSNSPFSAFLRHKNFSRRLTGLYFCGGSVHPGGGIPLCLKSASIVSNLVAKDLAV